MTRNRRERGRLANRRGWPPANTEETMTLFYSERLERSLALLKMYEPPEGYYLAFSGGKDSQVIYHLAQMAGVKQEK